MDASGLWASPSEDPVWSHHGTRHSVRSLLIIYWLPPGLLGEQPFAGRKDKQEIHLLLVFRTVTESAFPACSLSAEALATGTIPLRNKCNIRASGLGCYDPRTLPRV